jgi:hypothetical protein
MSRPCPSCGAGVEYAARSAQVLTGTCGQCGHLLAIIGDEPTSSADSGSSKSAESGGNIEDAGRGGAGGGSRSVDDRPTCEACGSTLTFHSAPDRGVEGACLGCGSNYTYVPAKVAGRETRRFGSTRSASSPQGRNRFPSSRGRPCRECGGALRFSTNSDGTVSAECGSCGNRFTLPPRRKPVGERDRGRESGFDRRSSLPFGRIGRPQRFGTPRSERFEPRPVGDDQDENRRNWRRRRRFRRE